MALLRNNKNTRVGAKGGAKNNAKSSTMKSHNNNTGNKSRMPSARTIVFLSLYGVVLYNLLWMYHEAQQYGSNSNSNINNGGTNKNGDGNINSTDNGFELPLQRKQKKPNENKTRKRSIPQGNDANASLSSLRNINEHNFRLPETKHHLMRLSNSSKVDAEDLGIQLATKSVNVYKPGSWDGAGIVIEEFKLVFFTQGKVACTVFKQLFRRMAYMKNWMKDSTDIPHNPLKNGLTYLYHYSSADALTILTHPDWTRAIFVRDPKERTLSAFLDKAARKNGKYVKRHCCIKGNATCGEEANASFLGFLRVIGELCCCDPHWKPQTERIDYAFRPFINFVGHFDRIQADTKRLLKSLHSNTLTKNHNGLNGGKSDPWTIFGASGWGKAGNESIFSEGSKAKHQTSATTKLRQYYNATSEALVEKLFAADYEDPILNFTRFSLFNEET